jgi:hypothetical protein
MKDEKENPRQNQIELGKQEWSDIEGQAAREAASARGSARVSKQEN